MFHQAVSRCVRARTRTSGRLRNHNKQTTMIAGLTVQIKPRRRCYRRAVLARAAASSLRRLLPTQARDAVARTRLRRLSRLQYAAPGASTGAPGAGAAHIQAPWASCCPRIAALAPRRGVEPRQSIILADRRARARGGLVFAKLSRRQFQRRLRGATPVRSPIRQRVPMSPQTAWWIDPSK